MTVRRYLWLGFLAVLAVSACQPAEELPFCERILTVEERPADHDALAAVFDEVRAEIYPDLADLRIELGPTPIEGAFFQANFDLDTLDWDPLERHYRVQYTDWLFDDPPCHAGSAAVLIHEHKHIEDYTGMDGEAMAEFAVWYIGGGEEVHAYERETDLRVLESGCGEALIRFREWVFF